MHSDERNQMKPAEGRKRVVIEEIQPQVDCGRYPARRFLGDRVAVSAAIFSDGHDHVAARLLYKHQSDPGWQSTPMTALGNDLWSADFTVDKLGPWSFTIQAWVDHFDTWCADLKKRLAAQPDPASSDPAKRDLPPQDIPLALTIGALLLDQTAARAKGADAKQLKTIAASLRALAGQNSPSTSTPSRRRRKQLAARYPDLSFASAAEQELRLWVDRERARFSSWYELFPRSTSRRPSPPRHLRRRRAPAAGDRRHGLRHPLPAAHPSHRPRLPQGPQQQHHPRPRRRGQSLGHRLP